MNRGLFGGLSAEARRYTPEMIVAGGGTPPTYGTGGISGRYVIDSDRKFCMGYISVIFASGTSGSGGNGTYQWSLPVKGVQGADAAVADYSIGHCYAAGNALGSGGTGAGIVYMATNGSSPDDGRYCSVVLESLVTTITATINSGQTSATVTHPYAVTPQFVIPIPNGDPNALGGYWISAKAATTFTINCHTAPGSNFSFTTTVGFPGQGFGVNAPWAIGTGSFGDHIDIHFMYPIA